MTNSLEPHLKRAELYNNQWLLLHSQLIKSAASLIRLFFIMNAGAILALLTFVGNQNSPHLFHKLHCSFIWLLIGLLTSVGSGVSEYLRQDYMLGDFLLKINPKSTDDKNHKTLTKVLLILAQVLGFISLIAFTVAVFKALNILSNP